MGYAFSPKVIQTVAAAPMSQKITVEQVQAAVRQNFIAMAEKKPGELPAMYAYDALSFNAFTTRPELGRVSAARREREYFKPGTSYTAEITSPIEVKLLADNVALAVYTYRSYGRNLVEPILGKRYNRAVADGRGTDVFTLDEYGKLVLAHQHLSDICRAPLEPVS